MRHCGICRREQDEERKLKSQSDKAKALARKIKSARQDRTFVAATVELVRVLGGVEQFAQAWAQHLTEVSASTSERKRTTTAMATARFFEVAQKIESSGA